MADLGTQIRDYLEATALAVDTAHRAPAPVRLSGSPRRAPGWVVATVAAGVIVLAVGIPAFLLLRDDGGVAVTEPTSGAPTTVPLATLPPATPVTTPSTTPTTVPGTAPPDPTSTTAPSTTTTVATPTTQALGLSPSGAIELPAGGPPFAPTVDADGRLVIAFYSEVDETIKLLRCLDFDCAAHDIVTLGPADTVLIEDSLQGPAGLAIALYPDGSPIVLAEHGTPTHGMLYACADPGCTSVTTADFVDEEPCVWPDGNPCPRVERSQLAIAPDGLPRILYHHGSPQRLELAECGDTLCTPESRITVTIDDAIEGYLGPTLHVEPDGTILIAYDKDDPDGVGGATVAICEGGSCADGVTTVRFDDGFGPRITTLADGGFAAWYRIGQRYTTEGEPERFQEVSDIMVAICTLQGCNEPTRVEAGEAWLSSWPVNTRLLQTPEGGIVAAFNYWFPDECASILEVGVSDDPLFATEPVASGRYQIAGPFDAIVHGQSLLLFFGAEQGGFQLAWVPLSEGLPSSFGEELPAECS